MTSDVKRSQTFYLTLFVISCGHVHIVSLVIMHCLKSLHVAKHLSSTTSVETANGNIVGESPPDGSGRVAFRLTGCVKP